MVNVIKPLQFINNPSPLSVFLGGTIDMGKSLDWQTYFISLLDSENSFDVYNPRRGYWDSNWGEGSEELKEQISWEINQQLNATYRLYYFTSNSVSPISLLELGLFASRGERNIVVCPEGYAKRTNVLFIADMYDMLILDSLEDAAECLNNIDIMYKLQKSRKF